MGYSWDIYITNTMIYIYICLLFSGVKKKMLLGIFLRNNGKINRTELNHLI